MRIEGQLLARGSMEKSRALASAVVNDRKGLAAVTALRELDRAQRRQISLQLASASSATSAITCVFVTTTRKRRHRPSGSVSR